MGTFSPNGVRACWGRIAHEHICFFLFVFLISEWKVSPQQQVLVDYDMGFGFRSIPPISSDI